MVCKTEELPCCDNPDIIVDFRSNIYTCRNCGITFPELSVVSQPKRAYSKEEYDARVHYAPMNRDFGSIVNFSIYKDIHGKSLSRNNQLLFNRLRRINRLSDIEQNFSMANSILKRIITKLNLSKVVFDTAWKFYKLVVEKRLTVGRTIEGFVIASVYIALRVHGIAFSINDLCNDADVSKKIINNAIKMIVIQIMPLCNMKLKPINMKDMHIRLCNKLNLSEEKKHESYNLLKNVIKNGFIYQGHSVSGIVAGVIYIVTRGTEEHKTQSEIADICHVTEVTLRNNVKKIEKFI